VAPLHPLQARVSPAEALAAPGAAPVLDGISAAFLLPHRSVLAVLANCSSVVGVFSARVVLVIAPTYALGKGSSCAYLSIRVMAWVPPCRSW
jgi:hypothetical protein